MVQQSIVNAKGQPATRTIFTEMWGRMTIDAGRTSAHTADLIAHEDYATLADGQTLIVPRANLAAAKGLLAAQRAAERRIAAQRAAQHAALNTTHAPTQASEPIGAASR